MRSLTAQFVAPVAVVLAGAAAGWFFYAAAWGLAAGTALATFAALLLARRIQRKLRLIQLKSTGAAGADVTDTFNAFDDVGVTLRVVSEASARKQRQMLIAERQLVQQAQVLDRMNDGLMRVDADHGIVYANVAAGTLFGGRNPTGRSFMGITRDHELNDALRRCLVTGDDQEHTFEIAGESRLVSAVIIRLDERPAEALVMLRDITEVSHLQNLRRDFVSNVSHELRTPLSTIKILSETLIDLREGDTEAVAYLSKIDSEVDSMTALVRDLLDLTRLEAPGGRLSVRGLDSGQLVVDVCERMLPLAERQRVALSASVEGPAVTFLGDERRLHQALVNLVTNAINHTPEGQVIVIETRANRERIDFSVRDTGIGIDGRDLPRIWERFFKTDKARSGPGTGLGLAIVKHIVQAHGGTVTAESVPGMGSTFTISIPRRNPPKQGTGGRMDATAGILMPE